MFDSLNPKLRKERVIYLPWEVSSLNFNTQRSQLEEESESSRKWSVSYQGSALCQKHFTASIFVPFVQLQLWGSCLRLKNLTFKTDLWGRIRILPQIELIEQPVVTPPQSLTINHEFLYQPVQNNFSCSAAADWSALKLFFILSPKLSKSQTSCNSCFTKMFVFEGEINRQQSPLY